MLTGAIAAKERVLELCSWTHRTKNSRSPGALKS